MLCWEFEDLLSFVIRANKRRIELSAVEKASIAIDFPSPGNILETNPYAGGANIYPITNKEVLDTALATTLWEWGTELRTWLVRIGRIKPMQNKSIDTNIRIGVSVFMKGIGRDTTVAKKEIKHKIPRL